MGEDVLGALWRTSMHIVPVALTVLAFLDRQAFRVELEHSRLLCPVSTVHHFESKSHESKSRSSQLSGLGPNVLQDWGPA